MRYFIIAFWALACGGAVARGQTTQPVEATWPQVVEQVTQSLLEGNLSALQSTLVDRSSIRQFGASDVDLSPRTLVDRTRGGLLIGYHAYIYPPLVMAADLAADFKNVTGVPDAVKAPMIPTDDIEMKRANATAVQWVGETLKVKDGDLVSVLAMWCTYPALPGVESALAGQTELVFVLIQGTRTDSGRPRVRQIVYGNPVPSTP